MRFWQYLMFGAVSCVLLSWLPVLERHRAGVGHVEYQYKESNEDFPNPERGFYRYSETKTSRYEHLDPEELLSYRQVHKVSKANYRIVSTLLFRYYELDNMTNRPLDESTLKAIQRDMDAVREAGLKLIPRFVYTTKSRSGNCPEGFICPPYGDAPKSIVLQHIAQLKPLLHRNTDVIACVQLGFIGTWGEQYYSDYFGDPSSNGSQGDKLTDGNWQDRFDVIKALLDAVPADRMVQVRYPQVKQRFVHGLKASVSAPGLTEEEAFTQTDAARIALHNDCYLSGPNDVGTYEDYGNNHSERDSDEPVVGALRRYAASEGKYVVVGGETCDDAFSPQNDCEPAGRAQQEFAEMHYSFLNAHYNNKVNNDWESGGCMDNIKRNLGYRFVLQSATFPVEATVGNHLSFTINLTNKGYASPYNARPVQLLLRKVGTQEITALSIETDVRKWYTGTINLETSVAIPKNLARGKYELLLNLPDAYESISTRPEYSIRLANTDVWEETTGYNKLNHTITVN